ncbi:unnamed protein product [Victoria cruziana]
MLIEGGERGYRIVARSCIQVKSFDSNPVHVILDFINLEFKLMLVENAATDTCVCLLSMSSTAPLYACGRENKWRN